MRNIILKKKQMIRSLIETYLRSKWYIHFSNRYRATFFGSLMIFCLIRDYIAFLYCLSNVNCIIILGKMLLFAHNYTFFAVLMSGHCPQRKNVKLLRDMQTIHHLIQGNKTNHFRVIKDEILIKLWKILERRFILAYTTDFDNRIIKYSFI